MQKSDALEQELEKLACSPIRELRQQYSTVFAAPPPPAFGPDLLRRSIALKLQEDLYGGLTPATQRELDRLVKQAARAPDCRINLPQRIKPGCILVRDWKGKSHRVTVLERGFDHDGKTYTNLSEIACLITGTHWNGPRFFGLRTGKE